MNSELLTVVGLALVPALGNFGGGVLAELSRPSKAISNRSLHAATGIILAVVSVEVMPRALGTEPASIGGRRTSRPLQEQRHGWSMLR